MFYITGISGLSERKYKKRILKLRAEILNVDVGGEISGSISCKHACALDQPGTSMYTFVMCINLHFYVCIGNVHALCMCIWLHLYMHVNAMCIVLGPQSECVVGH